MAWVALLFGSLVGLGCGTDGAQGGGDGGVADTFADVGGDAGRADAGPTDAGPTDADTGIGVVLEIDWTPCPLFSEGSDDERAECADIEVPLHWAEPDGERITLFVKRYRGAPGGGQVWVLTGGPGQSGSDIEPLVDQLITLDAGRSYYMIDHRGVGRSTRLRCPSGEGFDGPNGIGLGEGEIAACLDEVRTDWTDAQLAGFSTINAAHDVGQIIAQTRVDGEFVSISGGSYGTLWLERYLNLYPEQPSSVVFTAIAIDVDLLSVDRYVDEVTRRWLDACDADTGCGSRFQSAFGRSAREVVTDVFGGADAALCDDIAALDLDVPTLKPFFGQLVSELQGRSFYAPIVYRMARCEPRDVSAIAKLVEALSPPEGPQELPLTVRNWGFVLGENIAVNELVSARTDDQVMTDFDDAIAVQGATPRLIESRAIWPRYDAPPFENSDYQGPLLLLHGEFDFLPPAAYQRTVDHYLATNPNADFVLLPGAPHSLESPTTEGSQCGGSLLVSRLLSADAAVADCAAQVLPLRFAPTTQVSLALFGTDDPWDGAP